MLYLGKPENELELARRIMTGLATQEFNIFLIRAQMQSSSGSCMKQQTMVYIAINLYAMHPAAIFQQDITPNTPITHLINSIRYNNYYFQTG